MTAISAGDPADRTTKACRARLTPGPSRIHAPSSSDHKHASSPGAGTNTLSGLAVTARRYQDAPPPLSGHRCPGDCTQCDRSQTRGNEYRPFGHRKVAAPMADCYGCGLPYTPSISGRPARFSGSSGHHQPMSTVRRMAPRILGAQEGQQMDCGIS